MTTSLPSPLPDPDIHIKYLLRRAQTDRDEPLKFTVVNHHDGKATELQEYRHKRFLGEGVRYTMKSFEAFAPDPAPMILSS